MGKSHVQNMGIFFLVARGPESSCQISAYYKFFPGFNVFCRISTGLYNDSYSNIHIPRYCSVRKYQVVANVDTFDALVCKLLFRFMNRCHRSTNVFVHEGGSKKLFPICSTPSGLNKLKLPYLVNHLR